ncbi:shikimate kinase [Geomicrobium sediminis]|uniref:Shikimate kinase n=1 Tax=Geomicrobium sediminis TaxID=1347788 RepID=A0ABS2P852_9BACL|nr:shikimate kinase [Geomicrobium sediminis]MBM7631484.1 shikimate kinase [Geomicrobium sediminis]
MSSYREKSIVFIGFMGSGKTTIGEQVAKKLYRDFVDIDEEIEKEYGMPVIDIFKVHGEEAFRSKEKELIKGYCERPLKIISVGGGAFMNEEIREVCLQNCIVFFLDLSFNAWKERLTLLLPSRPVLQGKSIEEIEELFYKRQGIYADHNSKFTTDHLDIDEVSDYLIKSLKTSWDLYS